MLALSKRLITNARTRLELHNGLTPLRHWLHELSAREIEVVGYLWRGCRRPGLRRTAFCISWLGNGLAYLLLGLAILATSDSSARTVATAALCVAMAHLIYPWVKLACSRARPCDYRKELEPILASLDRHSFPSGHAMTLAAVLVPVLTTYPYAWPSAALAFLAMTWSRIACAHHYPSDMVAGLFLGMMVATPVSGLILK